jgi:L-ascorbate metabolism protein UlaG (beta-lactamase superfamily)
MKGSVLSARLVGGPTALLDFGGLRWLTDPTFDPPGEQPRGLVKLRGPALSAEEIGSVDVVLLSHDHHPDNLDGAGRAFLGNARHVLTTVAGAERLGVSATGLEPWSSHELRRPGAAPVTVTAVPAQHGPDGSDEIMGPVIGFVLTADDLPTVYISGDNASLDVVRAVTERLGPIAIAVLFVGGASIPARFDGAYLTLSNDLAVEAAKVLGAAAIIPVHFEGWAHFSSSGEGLRSAFAAAGLAQRLAFVEPGQTVSIS